MRMTSTGEHCKTSDNRPIDETGTTFQTVGVERLWERRITQAVEEKSADKLQYH
jgi:hypothetical protein